MIDLLNEYTKAFILVQICMVPVFVLFIIWLRKYSNYKAQSRILFFILAAAVLLPLFFTIPISNSGQLVREISNIPKQPAPIKLASNSINKNVETLSDNNYQMVKPKSILLTSIIDIDTTLVYIYKKAVKALDFAVKLFEIAVLIGFFLLILRIYRHILKIKSICSSGIILSRSIGSKKILVCSNHIVSVPFSTGVFRPIIFVPADLDPEDEEIVLAHEVVHITNGHIFRI